jgi:transposase
MNTKLHAVTDANGRPLSFFITAGQISDYTGAAALLDDLPKAKWMLADRGYDAEWFRDALEQKGITPCIPGRKSRSFQSNTTSADTNGAIASRSCSAG